MNEETPSPREVMESLPGFTLEPVAKPKRRGNTIFQIDKNAVGKKVLAARIAAGWGKRGDQGRFEKNLGWGQGTLSGIETGNKGMSNETMIVICKKFGLSPDILFGLPKATRPAGGPSNGKGVPLGEAIGPRVAFCTKHLNLSPQQLAALTGLSVATINEIARGDSDGFPETLCALSIVLKAPLSWLVGLPSFA
jgi:transcriptional regulator with XRE-family HTH domain